MTGDPYDATSRLGDDGLNGDLAVALAIWASRDDTKPGAHARRAASDAIDAIDACVPHPVRAPRPAGVRDPRQRRRLRRPRR